MTTILIPVAIASFLILWAFWMIGGECGWAMCPDCGAWNHADGRRTFEPLKEKDFDAVQIERQCKDCSLKDAIDKVIEDFDRCGVDQSHATPSNLHAERGNKDSAEAQHGQSTQQPVNYGHRVENNSGAIDRQETGSIEASLYRGPVKSGLHPTNLAPAPAASNPKAVSVSANGLHGSVARRTLKECGNIEGVLLAGCAVFFLAFLGAAIFDTVSGKLKPPTATSPTITPGPEFYTDPMIEEIRSQRAKKYRTGIEDSIEDAHKGDRFAYEYLESLNAINPKKTKADLEKMAAIRANWKWENGTPVYIGTNAQSKLKKGGQ